MKKINLVFISFVILGLTSSSAFADEDNAEERANEIHQLANSDMIYSQEETKAIYYQNIKIIDLLKQIRDILEQRLKEAKD